VKLEQFRKIRSRFDLKGSLSFAEDSGRGNAFQRYGLMLDAEHRALTQTDHWRVILFEIRSLFS